ncbi:MAG: hypothetical protein ACRYG4_09860 [Janthinobacterium lividum]
MEHSIALDEPEIAEEPPRFIPNKKFCFVAAPPREPIGDGQIPAAFEANSLLRVTNG